MTKNELFDSLEPLTLEEPTKIEINTILMDLDDNAQVPEEIMQKVINLLELENDLDQVIISALNQVQVSNTQLEGDLNTILSETQKDADLHTEDFTTQANQIAQSLNTTLGE
jgi:hypothetical protein